MPSEDEIVLPEEIAARIAPTWGKVAYLEAEYFGGTGW